MSLSYQHIYHAGNPADIQKHLWTLAVLQYLQKKDKPLFWCDTHAGRGLYDLTSPEAQKIKEYNNGIMRLYDKDIDHPLWRSLKETIQHYNDGNDLKKYPGSALMVAHHLRDGDRMECYDLHPQEFRHLDHALSSYKNVTPRKISMEEGIFACTSPKEKRGAILIDPSYEIKKEYQTIPKVVKRVIRKWPNATYMIWYPILPQERHEDLKDICKDIDSDVLIDEWIYDDPNGDGFKGMYGTGMAIFNPPYSVAETITECKNIILPLLKH